MKSPLFQHAAAADGTASEAGAMAFADPWEALGESSGKRDNWLLSYIDILTLFLTLFVVLLALQPKNEAPPVEADPGEFRFVAPQPIERQTASAALTLQTEPGQEPKTVDASLDPPADTDTVGHENTSMDRIPPFSFLLQTVKPIPITPMIFLPAGDRAAPAGSDPSYNIVESADGRSTTDPENGWEEPAVNAQPAPPEISHHRIQRFLTKLAQQQLDERVRVSEVAEGVYLEVSDNILFAVGSAELKRDGAGLLDELAQLLSEHTGIISVEGHTDDRPIATSRFPSNWELSSGRATSVTRYLIGKGLDPAKLRAVGYADTHPLQSNATAAGRARNRRVALIVEIPEI
ncbi:MAG: OmpA family protein [Gammaproteobacteria bacterium]|nr:OmpA family protein [Gammaproteobacteria bacterium]